MNPPFGLQKDFKHHLTVHFECPTVGHSKCTVKRCLKSFWRPKGGFERTPSNPPAYGPATASGPLASMLQRITIVQTSLVAAMRVCSWRSERNARVSGLRRCDERTRVNTCVNKSLFQALQISPVNSSESPPELLC